jgi:hypothetical protein
MHALPIVTVFEFLQIFLYLQLFKLLQYLQFSKVLNFIQAFFLLFTKLQAYKTSIFTSFCSNYNILIFTGFSVLYITVSPALSVFSNIYNFTSHSSIYKFYQYLKASSVFKSFTVLQLTNLSLLHVELLSLATGNYREFRDPH